MPSFSKGPHGTSIPPKSNKKMPAAALLHRSSTLPPYTMVEQPVDLPSIDATHDQVHDPPLIPPVPPGTVHQYTLRSRGRDYAHITVASRAKNTQDHPLLYFGEELKGSLVFSPNDLNDMRSIDVVLQMFESDPTPSYEAKRVLLPHQVDHSHVSDGQFCWPFSLASPTTSVSSSSASSASHSSLGYLSSNTHSDGSGIMFQLGVTIHRRGRLSRNLGMRQQITYVLTPDPSVQSEPPPYSVDLPRVPRDPPAISWPRQTFPPVLVRGVMFGQIPIQVECKLVSPSSYAASDIIPLRLTLTSEQRESLDVFAVSNVIDVRLQKVLVFGEQAAAVHPSILNNSNSFHRTDLAARSARWQLDGRAREHLPDAEHPRPRWSIELKGKFDRETGVELTPSFDEPGMSLVYFVSLFGSHTKEFRPVTNPKKALLMGKIQLTAPNRSTS